MKSIRAILIVVIQNNNYQLWEFSTSVLNFIKSLHRSPMLLLTNLSGITKVFFI